MAALAYDGWRVRIRAVDGTVYGAGVLVAEDLVLTCAHVVARALRVAKSGPRPTGSVVVDFPTAAHVERLTAQVDPDGWVAAAPDHTGDLALLRLDRPSGIVPADLAFCGAPTRREVRVFGHPGGDELGRWAFVTISGTAGPTGEWMQLTAGQATGPRIEPGFSGAGVVDEYGTVIGVVVGMDRQESNRGAWMVTVEATLGRLPSLRPLLDGDRSGRPAVPTAVAESGTGRGAGRNDFEQRMVECLLRLDGIGDRGHRDDLVAVIERGLDGPLNARRADRPRSDVLHIVMACRDHPTGNGLAQLVDAVRALHGETGPVGQLARLVAWDPGRRLSPAQVDLLRDIVVALPEDEVRQASQAAFGAMGPRIDLEADNPGEVVRALTERMGSSGQAPPLVVFLRRLADRLPGPTAEALGIWVEHIAHRWQVPVDEPATSTPVAPAPNRSYLVVELREDGPNPDQYLLSIWLQHDNADGHALMVDDDQPLTLEEIPGHVGEHLRRVTRQLVGPIGDLTIEFVLPYRLLDHEVDQFRVVLDRVRTPIGAAYPVVVRSLDRMTNQMIRHRWQTRSDWLRENQDTHDSKAVSWVQLDSGAGRQALEDELRRDPDGYQDGFPVCLVLAVNGRGRAGAGRAGVENAIRNVLEIGMPVLVWCRTPRLTGQFLAAMANQLNGRPLAELPAVIRRLRQEATMADRGEQLGAHLSLLWDLSHRLPPSQALRAPSWKD